MATQKENKGGFTLKPIPEWVFPPNSTELKKAGGETDTSKYRKPLKPIPEWVFPPNSIELKRARGETDTSKLRNGSASKPLKPIPELVFPPNSSELKKRSKFVLTPMPELVFPSHSSSKKFLSVLEDRPTNRSKSLKKELFKSPAIKVENKTGKRFRNIPQITFTFDNQERRSKIRKIEDVSKTKSPSSLSKRPAVNKKFQKKLEPARTSVKKVQFSSPLLDIEEVEEDLINNKMNGFCFKSPSTPNLKFNNNNNVTTPKRQNSQTSYVLNGINMTPKTYQNEKEFLEIEEICEKSNNPNESPVSSMCDLLQNTLLNSTKKDNNNLLKQIETIESLLKLQRREFNNYKNNFEEKMLQIEEILTDLKNYSNENKENCPSANRRSIRLALKEANGQAVSPSFSKPTDLRKSTLRKNLQNNMSPRTKKALETYNEMKNNFNTTLATPKLNRSNLITPKSDILSRRLQSQCFALQDTPVRK